MGQALPKRGQPHRPATPEGHQRTLVVVRVLILYANPVAASFGAALHQQAVRALHASGHDIDDCDLYAESFDPILSERERIQNHNVEANRAD
jgi:putative NADPH-quinone reductase